MVTTGQCQNVVVLRHGDHIDKGADKLWWTAVPKPWDAPLTTADRHGALETGGNLQAQLKFPIHQIVVSPFKRCVETASELIKVLSSGDAGHGNPAYSSTSRIKVSIDYGMCEMMNDVALWYHPTDHNSWGFDIAKLEASFPPKLAKVTPDRVFKELPEWGESESMAKDRYLFTIHSLVDKYPEENILFITHGEGVKAVALTYWEKAKGHKIEPHNFGYVHLERQLHQNGDSFTANRFRIVESPGETGIGCE